MDEKKKKNNQGIPSAGRGVRFRGFNLTTERPRCQSLRDTTVTGKRSTQVSTQQI